MSTARTTEAPTQRGSLLRDCLDCPPHAQLGCPCLLTRVFVCEIDVYLKQHGIVDEFLQHHGALRQGRLVHTAKHAKGDEQSKERGGETQRMSENEGDIAIRCQPHPQLATAGARAALTR